MNRITTNVKIIFVTCVMTILKTNFKKQLRINCLIKIFFLTNSLLVDVKNKKIRSEFQALSAMQIILSQNSHQKTSQNNNNNINEIDQQNEI